MWEGTYHLVHVISERRSKAEISTNVPNWPISMITYRLHHGGKNVKRINSSRPVYTQITRLCHKWRGLNYEPSCSITHLQRNPPPSHTSQKNPFHPCDNQASFGTYVIKLLRVILMQQCRDVLRLVIPSFCNVIWSRRMSIVEFRLLSDLIFHLRLSQINSLWLSHAKCT